MAGHATTVNETYHGREIFRFPQDQWFDNELRCICLPVQALMRARLGVTSESSFDSYKKSRKLCTQHAIQDSARRVNQPSAAAGGERQNRIGEL